MSEERAQYPATDISVKRVFMGATWEQQLEGERRDVYVSNSLTVRKRVHATCVPEATAGSVVQK